MNRRKRKITKNTKNKQVPRFEIGKKSFKKQEINEKLPFTQSLKKCTIP